MTSRRDGSTPDEAPPERRPATVPPALRDGAYARVRAAWAEGCRAHAPHHPPLRAALEQLARTARAEALPVASLLRTLDAVCRPHAGGDAALDWDHVREWAGRVVIGAYYAAARDD